jgi:hypothetical protein
MTGWRDIETAPKDGRTILAYNAVTGAYTTAFKDDEWPLGFWGGQLGQWFPRPSHWMPLPAPPEPRP